MTTAIIRAGGIRSAIARAAELRSPPAPRLLAVRPVVSDQPDGLAEHRGQPLAAVPDDEVPVHVNARLGRGPRRGVADVSDPSGRQA
jgi:hypothetical protein